MPKVVNIRDRGVPPGTIRVDRRTEWGNPFIISRDGDREQVIKRYRTYLMDKPELLAALPSLKGHDLACWCAPLPCHADILLALANPDD